MSLIRKHGAVLQAWACLDLVYPTFTNVFFLIFSTFLRFITFFYFHLNAYYIYGRV